MPKSLMELEAEIKESFNLLNYPPKSVIPSLTDPKGKVMIDALIVGGGMNGLAAAFALRRLGVEKIRQIDTAEPGKAGPWRTYARMEFLRSGKNLTGPSLGHSLLTPRSWWQAKHPGAKWEEGGYFKREEWADYIEWYGKITGAIVEYRTELKSLDAHDKFVDVSIISDGNKLSHFCARNVILATGRDGLATPRIPIAFEKLRDDHRVLHSSKIFDPSTMAAKRVAVIGLAASAFDNAALVAEAGATVTIIGRAMEVPRLNKMKHTVTAAFAEGFPLLPNTEKLRWLTHITECRIAPPHHTVKRVAGLGVKLLTGNSVKRVEIKNESLELFLDKSSVEVDQVILATGFKMDLSSVGFLKNVFDDIKLWADALPEKDKEDRNNEWMEFPFLGNGFEFLAKQKNRISAIQRIFCFNHASQLSLGNLANDIPHASFGAERLGRAIVSSLFIEDKYYHYQTLLDYSDPELAGDEWPGQL